MIRAEDLTWNIRAQERAVREDFDRDIAALQAALRAAYDLASLAGNSAFASFVQKLRLLHDDAIKRMRDHQGPDHEVRVLQGRCQAMADVLELCVKAPARAQELEQRLLRLQDARDKTVLPDGSIVPQGPVT